MLLDQLITVCFDLLFRNLGGMTAAQIARELRAQHSLDSKELTLPDVQTALRALEDDSKLDSIAAKNVRTYYVPGRGPSPTQKTISWVGATIGIKPQTWCSPLGGGL